MKILFAIKSLNNVGGGAERVLTDVTSGLIERGHSIFILSYDPPCGRSFYPLHPDVQRIDLGIGDSKGRATIWETVRRIMALRATIVKASPDIVVGFMHSIFIPLGFALLGTRIPLIASEHIGVEYYRLHFFERLLLQVTPFVTRQTTIISEKLRNDYGPHLRNHMVVIPNPVNIVKNNRSADLRRDTGVSRILSVGRLVSQKDHATLVEAFAILADEFLEWELRIMGDGELRPDLESQIKYLGLGGRVHLASTTLDIEEEYQRAQIFAIPSLYESFGLVTAEALTYGLPAIGFADCPGTNELVKHNRNGILVQGSPRATALADGLRLLMESPELRQRLGAAGPDSMVPFSKEKICDLWEELLRKFHRV